MKMARGRADHSFWRELIAARLGVADEELEPVALGIGEIDRQRVAVAGRDHVIQGGVVDGGPVLEPTSKLIACSRVSV